VKSSSGRQSARWSARQSLSLFGAIRLSGLSRAHRGRARGGQAAGRHLQGETGSAVHSAHRFGRTGESLLPRARICTTRLGRARVPAGPGPDRFSRSQAGLTGLLNPLAEDACSGPSRAGPRSGVRLQLRLWGADAGPPHRVGGSGRSLLCSHPSGSLRCCVCLWSSVWHRSGFVAWARRRRRRALPSSRRGPWGPHGALRLTPCRASALFTPSRVLAGTGSRPPASSPAGAAGCASKSCNPAALALLSLSL
jgi:hypothetical protein